MPLGVEIENLLKQNDARLDRCAKLVTRCGSISFCLAILKFIFLPLDEQKLVPDFLGHIAKKHNVIGLAIYVVLSGFDCKKLISH